MTRHELVRSIRAVLEEKMGMKGIQVFDEQSRLNEELRLDSVRLLELLLHLELDMGLSIPEAQLPQSPLATVGSLADFLLGART